MSRLEMPRKIHMKSVLYLLTLLITPALTPLAGDGTPPE